jgi:hypothetical protein
MSGALVVAVMHDWGDTFALPPPGEERVARKDRVALAAVLRVEPRPRDPAMAVLAMQLETPVPALFEVGHVRRIRPDEEEEQVCYSDHGFGATMGRPLAPTDGTGNPSIRAELRKE